MRGGRRRGEASPQDVGAVSLASGDVAEDGRDTQMRQRVGNSSDGEHANGAVSGEAEIDAAREMLGVNRIRCPCRAWLPACARHTLHSLSNFESRQRIQACGHPFCRRGRLVRWAPRHSRPSTDIRDMRARVSLRAGTFSRSFARASCADPGVRVHSFWRHCQCPSTSASCGRARRSGGMRVAAHRKPRGLV